MPTNVDWKSLYPFESRFLSLDGQRYHYLDEGQGETLLLVHGNPTWSFHWRELVTAWRKQYRVVVPDHLGCGLSDKPADYPYTLAQHTTNLLRLLEHLNLDRVTLVAQDWGGAIGMGAAAREPERFARFVLCNTAAFRSRRMPWRIRVCRTPILGRLAVQGFNGFARAALWMAVAHHDRLTPQVKAGLLAPYDSWTHRTAIHHFVKDIPLAKGHPSYDELLAVEEGLPRLAERPVMLVWGMRDWCFTPHFLDRFLEFFPAAEVLRFDDAGHWVVEDAHERIAPAVEAFLASHSLASNKAGM